MSKFLSVILILSALIGGASTAFAYKAKATPPVLHAVRPTPVRTTGALISQSPRITNFILFDLTIDTSNGDVYVLAGVGPAAAFGWPAGAYCDGTATATTKGCTWNWSQFVAMPWVLHFDKDLTYLGGFMVGGNMFADPATGLMSTSRLQPYMPNCNLSAINASDFQNMWGTAWTGTNDYDGANYMVWGHSFFYGITYYPLTDSLFVGGGYTCNDSATASTAPSPMPVVQQDRGAHFGALLLNISKSNGYLTTLKNYANDVALGPFNGQVSRVIEKGGIVYFKDSQCASCTAISANPLVSSRIASLVPDGVTISENLTLNPRVSFTETNPVSMGSPNSKMPRTGFEVASGGAFSLLGGFNVTQPAVSTLTTAGYSNVLYPSDTTISPAIPSPTGVTESETDLYFSGYGAVYNGTNWIYDKPTRFITANSCWVISGATWCLNNYCNSLYPTAAVVPTIANDCVNSGVSRLVQNGIYKQSKADGKGTFVNIAPNKSAYAGASYTASIRNEYTQIKYSKGENAIYALRKARAGNLLGVEAYYVQKIVP